MICTKFSPSCELSFYFINSVFYTINIFNYDNAQFTYFCCVFDVRSKKPLPDPKSRIIYPYVFFKVS